jgi:hypothetical protein
LVEIGEMKEKGEVDNDKREKVYGGFKQLPL